MASQNLLFSLVYWCRLSPKSYQKLGFQVYDMYFFGGVGLYLFNCLIFTLCHSIIYGIYFCFLILVLVLKSILKLQSAVKFPNNNNNSVDRSSAVFQVNFIV